MVRQTWVQYQVASYQRLLKGYLIPPCLTLCNIRYVLKVKWSNSGKGVGPSPTPQCSSYWKGNLQVALDYGCKLYFFTLFLSGNISPIWPLTHIALNIVTNKYYNQRINVATKYVYIYIYILKNSEKLTCFYDSFGWSLEHFQWSLY